MLWPLIFHANAMTFSQSPFHSAGQARPVREKASVGIKAAIFLIAALGMINAISSETLASNSPSAANAQDVPRLYIREYRVDGGAHLLPSTEIETAVYPYLGP